MIPKKPQLHTQYQIIPEPFDAYNKDLPIQTALGSERASRKQEASDIRSVNWVPGVSGWRLTPRGLELGGPFSGGAASPVDSLQFNSGGSFAGSSDLTWSSGTLNIVGYMHSVAAIIEAKLTVGNGYPAGGGEVAIDNAGGNVLVGPLIHWLPVNNTNFGGNTFVGDAVANALNEGANTFGNTWIGQYAAREALDGIQNTFVGGNSGSVHIHVGTGNTAIGYGALQGSASDTLGTYNVAIGYQAGYGATASNKLYIANNSSRSLIYGEFDTGIVAFVNSSNGKKAIFDNSLIATSDKTFTFPNQSGTLALVGGVTQYTDEMAQDAVGAMLDASLTYVDATPSLGITAAYRRKSLFDHYADVGNVGTGEDDLYSDTIAAAQLANNGEKLEAEYGGVFVSSATATREIKAYFGGTMIFATGALTLSLSSAWTMYVSIVRVSASVVRYVVSMTTEGAALAAYTAVGEVTGLTLSNTNILKITGEAAGVGAATNDIVAKMASVEWLAAA